MKRKRAPSSANEAVMSATSIVTPRLSANVGKLSADTDTLAAVDANLGPAAKRSRRTTLTHAKQKKGSDGATPAAVLFADIRKKRDELQTAKGKQTTSEEGSKVPLNCEMQTVVIYFVKENVHTAILPPLSTSQGYGGFAVMVASFVT